MIFCFGFLNLIKPDNAATVIPHAIDFKAERRDLGFENKVVLNSFKLSNDDIHYTPLLDEHYIFL